MVLQLHDAYEAMDHEAYVDCLADDFVFYVAEYIHWDDPSVPEQWSFGTEDTIHRRMFGAIEVPEQFRVDSVAIWVAVTDSTSDTGADSLDAGDDRWTLVVNATARLYFPDNLQRLGQGYQRLVLQQDPDDEGPDGEPLYEIVEWHDLDPWLRGPERAEGSSWSLVKLLFR